MRDNGLETLDDLQISTNEGFPRAGQTNEPQLWVDE
jgi:hypothetical protein